MENNNQLESGFRIQNILLLESNFTRVTNVTFNNPEIRQNTEFNINVNLKDEKTLYVIEQITFKQIFNDIEEIVAIIKMIGIFEKIGDIPMSLEVFGHTNAPAIIFPYIREHLSNLSAKAGLGLIILPPINFTKLQPPVQQ